MTMRRKKNDEKHLKCEEKEEKREKDKVVVTPHLPAQKKSVITTSSQEHLSLCGVWWSPRVCVGFPRDAPKKPKTPCIWVHRKSKLPPTDLIKKTINLWGVSSMWIWVSEFHSDKGNVNTGWYYFESELAK